MFGGKITTYRKLAEHALDRLRPVLPAAMGPAWTAAAPLPGGDMPGRRLRGLAAPLPRPAALAAGGAGPALRPALRHPRRRAAGGRRQRSSDLGRHFGGLLYEREARFLLAEEWARTADDILERRTKHDLHLTQAERRAFSAWLAAQSPPRLTYAAG